MLRRTLAAVVFLLVLTTPVGAQSLVKTGPQGEDPVEIVVGGVTYLSIDKNGVISAKNGASWLVEPLTASTPKRVPYYDTDGTLTSTSGFFWDPVAEKLNILGGVTANNGPLLVTRKATGGDPILASGISVYRNSQYGSGTPTVNDIVNAEFLLQGSDNLWYTVGGVGGKITNIGAPAGGPIFHCKPTAAFGVDNTVPCMFLSSLKKLRIGDGNEATAPLELLEVATGFVLSSPATLTQNEIIAVKPAIGTGTPANPTGTASTTALLMGTAMSFTPKLHGRTSMQCSLILQQSASGSGATVVMFSGTGTAPVHGAATSAGTQRGGSKSFTAIAANQEIGVVLQAVPTLTVGVANWIDLAVNATTSGTATAKSISCVFIEM